MKTRKRTTRRVLRPWVKHFLTINRILIIVVFLSMMTATTIGTKINTEAMEFPTTENTTEKEVLVIDDTPSSMFQEEVLETETDSNPERVEDDEDLFDDYEEVTPEETVQEPTIEYDLDNIGYVGVSGLRVRENPDINSNVIEYLSYGDKIEYSIYDDEWLVIKLNDNYSYVSNKYIIDTLPNYRAKSVVGDKRKSYMDYTAITSKSSPQYKLQHKYAHTDDTGIRMVDGRYCIALGSYYTHRIGQYVDLVLENGEVIECIIGDQKDDRDTNSSNTIAHDGSATEFIVETKALPRMVRRMGDIGYTYDGWLSKVIEIRIYDKILDL
nr:MAG TPA: SH3 domain protein [Caudoviricetes sp.]